MDYQTLKCLKKEQLAKHGRLHAEAWQCRLCGDMEGMQEKQRDALRAFWTSRTYDYLMSIYSKSNKVNEKHGNVRS